MQIPAKFTDVALLLELWERFVNKQHKMGFYSGTRVERLEIADGRDIEDEAAAATVTAEKNNEQPASDSDTSSSIDSGHNTN